MRVEGKQSTDLPAAAEDSRAPSGGAPKNLLSDFAHQRGEKWKRLWAAWQQLQEQHKGISRKDAAALLGVGDVTLWRLEKQYAQRGFKSDVENCGRTSNWEYLVKNDGPVEVAFREKLRELYLATIGAGSANMARGRRTAKMALALAAIAEDTVCPADLAPRLKRGRFPVCLLRFLKRITPELENRMRGPKHFQLNGLTSRRDLTLRFPNGDRAEMPAGFKWVFDDMSSNQPFWAHVDNRLLFSRQGLYAIDQRSLRWLGKMLVARPREAYRAEDILRFLRELFRVYGKPDMIVFELSVWHSRKIRGFKVLADGHHGDQVVEDEFERPEMPEEERTMLQRGLEAIGVRLEFAHSAHGKVIETCFNYLQSVLAMFAKDYVNIGRHAGEFETGAKRMRQVRAGSHGPGQVGFATMQQLSECIDRAFAFINAKTNSRGEVPDEVWGKTVGFSSAAGEDTRGPVGEAPARPLPQLEPNDYAAFLPDLREPTISGGCVTVRVRGQEHDFRAPWMAELGTGFKVFAKFDETEPTLGAAIYNRETSPANIHGWKKGQFIGWAVWEMPAPAADVIGQVRGVDPRPVEQFYGPGAFDNGDNLRRKQTKLVATAFSALPRPGQPAVKSSEARDGSGRVVRIESGVERREPRDESQTRVKRSAFAEPTSDEVAKRRARLARQAAFAKLIEPGRDEPLPRNLETPDLAPLEQT